MVEKYIWRKICHTLNSLFAVGKTSCFPVVCSYFKGVYSLRSLMKKRCVMFLLCNCFPAPLNNCHGSTRVAHDLTERKLQEPTQTSSLLIFHMFPVELIQLDTIGKSEREHRRNLWWSSSKLGNDSRCLKVVYFNTFFSAFVKKKTALKQSALKVRITFCPTPPVCLILTLIQPP